MLCKAFCPPYDPQAANDLAVIPLRLQKLEGISDANNFPPSPTADVYASIISDLEDAFLLLPKDFNEVDDTFKESYQWGRVNKFAVAAMLARVYFQMGNSGKALEYCNFVIDQNEGRYDLSEEPIEVWNESIYASSKDGIWYYAVGDGPRVNGLGGNSSNWKAPRRFAHWNYQIPGFPSGSGTVSGIGTNNRTLAFSRSLLNQVGWVDANLDATDVALRDKRYTQLVQRVAAGADPTFPSVNEVQYWNNKYYRGPNSSRRIGGIPLLRFAEVVLTRAILRYNANNLQGAADDLNMVRRRAWNEEVAGEPYTDLTSAQITADLIHRERMIEMAFEGDRIHYLQALKLSIPPGDRSTGPIPYNDPSLRWPIPVRERELNQSIGN